MGRCHLKPVRLLGLLNQGSSIVSALDSCTMLLMTKSFQVRLYIFLTYHSNSDTFFCPFLFLFASMTANCYAADYDEANFKCNDVACT
jgi:hypothetical protein